MSHSIVMSACRRVMQAARHPSIDMPDDGQAGQLCRGFGSGGFQAATMWSLSHTRVSAGLLVVLWTSVLTCAESESRCADSQQAPPLGTLDQLVWSFIDRVETRAAQSVLARLEEVHASLTAQISGLSSQMGSCRTRPSDELSTRVTELSAQVTELYSRKDDCSQLDGRLSTQLTELSDRLDRHMETVAGASQEVPRTPPRDCSDLPAGSVSGVHTLQLELRGTVPVPAFCDLETDGGNWTVFQRRADVKPRENFYRGWAAYQEGFGELDEEFWWGLNNIWAMTSLRDRQYELRIDLEDFEGGKRHAIYHNFRVASESDGYRLTVTGYAGDAGDSLKHHIGSRFSTKDKDLDSYSGHCAQSYKGAWWYGSCHDSNLNGQYLAGQHSSHADGVNWQTWRGDNYSLKRTTMKIRPTRKLGS